MRAMRILALDDATPDTSGRKAATLATLRRAGIGVPNGFVIPISEYERHHDVLSEGQAPTQPDSELVDAIEAHLERLAGGDGYVAVRSSAGDEDGPRASSAGQHDTVLGAGGAHAVAAAVARCWASLHSLRATAYRDRQPIASDRAPTMAVLIQRLVDAEVSGVLFTRTPRVIEAIPGLGAPLVSGEVTPDAWTLDDTGIIARRHGDIRHRLDRDGGRLVATTAQPPDQMCLTDTAVLELDRLGRAIRTTLGYEADVEWARTNHRFHTLQARPITASLGRLGGQGQGIAASPGRATGAACILRGPADFHRLARGDILVCRTTDPAWSPLFSRAAGVVTETGGLLSHAAIVARELGIPAVLAVPHATTRFRDGTVITSPRASRGPRPRPR